MAPRRYRPLDQDQPNGYTCVDTSTSMEIDQSTAGVKRPHPFTLRDATGKSRTVGISYLDAAAAAEKVSNVELRPRFLIDIDDVVTLCPSGKGFIVSIEAAITWPTECRTGFLREGGHSMKVVAGPTRWPGGSPCFCEKHSSTPHSEYTYQDPGTFSVGYRQISAELLHRAAMARTGGRGINVLVGVDTTKVWRQGKGRGSARKWPSTKAPATRRVERRPYFVEEVVEGERWARANGGYSTAWYRTAHDDFIRGDRLGTVNVAAP